MGFEPEEQYYCRTRDVFQSRLERLQSDLKNILSEDKAALVTAITGEIGNNSYDHNLGNWEDVMGIFFACSLSEKSIVLADRGQGILKTLRRVKPGLKNHKSALKVAFSERISGRYPENRGNGLKFVKQVVNQNNISLTFQTGDALLNLENKNGKIDIDTADSSIVGCLVTVSY